MEVKRTPYWWEAGPRPEEGPAPVPSHADCVIVGSGYSGLSAARTLAQAGRLVVVFEADRPGEGASSRNGGITSGNIRPSFSSLAKKYGLATAKAIYGEGVEARRWLGELITEEKIDCFYQMTGRFTGAVQPSHFENMKREADLLVKNLDISIDVIEKGDVRQEVGTDLYHGGLLRDDIGGLHPGLFHLGLLDAARRAGATVIGHTPVTLIEREPDDGFRVTTTRGTTRCRDVIVATNGYSGAATPFMRDRVVPVRSQIVATEPLGDNIMKQLMPKGRMLGETRRLGHYFRPSPDGKCILFGGRAVADPDRSTDPAGHLRKRLGEVFPEIDGVGITHTWWGFVAFNFDELPHLHKQDGIIYIGAYAGSGVVWAPWLGRKAALTLLGEVSAETAFADLDFTTRPLYSGRPWFLPPIFWWMGLKDRLGL